MSTENPKQTRERIHSSRFFWTAIAVLLVVVIVAVIAKLTAGKILRWLE